MATQIRDSSTESTPLLRPPPSEASSETLTEGGQYEPDLDGASQSVGKRRAVLIILSLGLLIFVQASNMSAMTTIQSAIAGDLDAYARANWFTSAYLISMASISPLAGRLALLFSPRNCIVVSAIFFSIGGVVTSQAKTFEIFILGRVISGVGAAGVMTISIILVLELTNKKRRGIFIGLLNTGYTIGVALGATVAGALLPVTGWRILFLAQSPLALLAGVCIFLSIPQSFVSSRQNVGKESLSQKLAKIDYLGAITLTSTIVLFLYGLASPKIEGTPMVISAVLLPLFILNELYVANTPIIPVTFLKSRGALFSCFAQLGLMCARWMFLLFCPVYVIAVHGWSPAHAGTTLIPANVGFAAGSLLVGAVHIRRAGSFYISCLACFTLFTMTLFIGSQLCTLETSPTYIFGVAFANGLCTGAALNYTLAQLLHITDPSSHFVGAALLATFRGFAGSFASAVGGGIFIRALQSSLQAGFEERGMKGEEGLVRQLLGSPALVASLEGAEKDVAIAAYVTAIRTLFMAAGCLGVINIGLQSGTGWKSPKERSDVVDQAEEGTDH